MRFSKEYTTWIPVFLKLAQKTNGAILELGSGVFSTPLLHWVCAEKRRELWTYEDTKEYLEFAHLFKSRNHHIRLVEDWEKVDFPNGSIALIDQIKNRAETAIMLKDKVDYVILHDSEAPEVYDYEKVYPHFKYRYDWKFCKPYATVLSNKNPLTWMI
ncbi:MAG: hypothetical protein AAB875_02400 [Patescibacteria group bacterium]